MPFEQKPDAEPVAEPAGRDLPTFGISKGMKSTVNEHWKIKDDDGERDWIVNGKKLAMYSVNNSTDLCKYNTEYESQRSKNTGKDSDDERVKDFP